MWKSTESITVLYAEVKSATRFCADCKADYCSDCAGSLHSNKTLAKHQLVDLSKKSSVMGPPLCQVHKTRHMDMYCIDCKVLTGDTSTRSHVIASLGVCCFAIGPQTGGDM